MSYSASTQYLGLRLIDLKSTSWYSDMVENFQKIDNIAKNFMVQSRPGARTAIRVALQTGELVDAITIDPKNDGTLAITLGRLNGSDKVSIVGSFVHLSMGLNNQNTLGYGRTLRQFANYALDQDVSVYWDTRQNIKTYFRIPVGAGVPFEGSSFQLEAMRTYSNGQEVPNCLEFEATDANGNKRKFIIPTYERN